MKRIMIVFGVVALMAAMIVTLAAPAMAKDKGGHPNGGIDRLDNRLDRLDNRLGFDRDIDVDFVSDVDRSPVFISTNNVNSCWLWNGRTCPLGTEVLNSDFVSDIDFDVDFNRPFNRNIDFDRDIDVDFDRDIDFVDVDRNIGFSHGNNHNGEAHHNANVKGNGNNHNGGAGQKGNGK